MIIALWLRLAPICNRAQVLALPVLLPAVPAAPAVVRVVQARAHHLTPTNQAVKRKIKRRRSNRQSKSNKRKQHKRRVKRTPLSTRKLSKDCKTALRRKRTRN